MDKISVIIPTRNRWKLLNERAIPSVYNQTYKNWELIIVDESDVGNTYSTWHDKKNKHYHIKKVYHYPKKNKKAEWLAGPVRALNFALSKVTGDYIARLDDDDVWRKDCLETLLDFLKKEDADFVSAMWQGLPDKIGLPEIINGFKVGGVQTWLYKSIYKNILYNENCWKKKWNANNEWDWFERFLILEPEAKISFLHQCVCEVNPRPGETEIGSKALKEK